MIFKYLCILLVTVLYITLCQCDESKILDYRKALKLGNKKIPRTPVDFEYPEDPEGPEDPANPTDPTDPEDPNTTTTENWDTTTTTEYWDTTSTTEYWDTTTTTVPEETTAPSESTTSSTTTEAPVICTRPGKTCKSCAEVLSCFDIGNGTFENIITDICDNTNGISCMNGECTNHTNPHCGTLSKTHFKCEAVGMFPDPFDCQTFHVCYRNKNGELVNDEERCEFGYGYDMISTYCETELVNGCPEEPPVPYCMEAGQADALINDSIFYVCAPQVVDSTMVLYPYLFLCNNGKSFVNDTCVHRDQISTTPNGESTTPATSTSLTY